MSGISRRQFVRGAVAAAGAVSLSHVPTARALGANDRINIASIGIGGMGGAHLGSLVKKSETNNTKVVAVCDLYQKRLNAAQAVSKGEPYTDYRKLLENKDIDAVVIATPDHWHSKITVDAMAAGKHVYCEKPMTHTIEQALQTREAVKKYKKVFQVGPQATASDVTWKARDAIAAGRIGKVTLAQGSYNRNARICMFSTTPPIDPNAGPEKSGENHIDWDMWLGHEWGLAPKIPYNPEHFFHFRKFWPYNGGVATDLMYHKLAPLLLAIAGPHGEYPSRVNACGGLYIEKDGRDIPDTFVITADFPSEFTVILISTLTNDTPIPDRIYGKYGTLDMGGDVTLTGNGGMKPEFQEKNGGKDDAHIALAPRSDLEDNFLSCIRNGGETFCNVDLATSTMITIKMGVESYRQKKTLLWDEKAEKVTTA
jgi:predicted dehydrogenase